MKRFLLMLAVVGLSCSVSLADCEQETAAHDDAVDLFEEADRQWTLAATRMEAARDRWQIKNAQVIAQAEYINSLPWYELLASDAGQVLRDLIAERETALAAYRQAFDAYLLACDEWHLAFDAKNEAWRIMMRCKGRI